MKQFLHQWQFGRRHHKCNRRCCLGFRYLTQTTRTPAPHHHGEIGGSSVTETHKKWPKQRKPMREKLTNKQTNKHAQTSKKKKCMAFLKFNSVRMNGNLWAPDVVQDSTVMPSYYKNTGSSASSLLTDRRVNYIKHTRRGPNKADRQNKTTSANLFPLNKNTHSRKWSLISENVKGDSEKSQ